MKCLLRFATEFYNFSRMYIATFLYMFSQSLCKANRAFVAWWGLKQGVYVLFSQVAVINKAVAPGFRRE